jgi:hypothetical protein
MLALARHHVGLHVSPLAADVIFDLARGSVEGVANGNVDVLVRVVLSRLAAHDELAAGKREIEADVEEVSLPMTSVRRLDHHPATRDVIGEAVELGGLLAHSSLDCVGRLHSSECDLNWELHRISSLFVSDVYRNFSANLPRTAPP